MKFQIVILITLLCFNCSDCANILFYMGISTYSHRISLWPMVEKLSEKGHEITFLQPFTPKKPNPKIREFFPQDLALQLQKSWSEKDLLRSRLEGGLAKIASFSYSFPARSVAQCRDFLLHEETQAWLQTSTFDLVVIDGLFNECGYGIAHYFKAKTILFDTSHVAAWMYDMFGLVMETSWMPEMHYGYYFPMSWYERLETTIDVLERYYAKVVTSYPELDKVFRHVFQNEEFPRTEDMVRDTAIVFTNSHFGEELARPFPPMIVPVGGMYCGGSETEPLPKDLADFLESSDGFVYLSFGSAVNFSSAPAEFQSIFLSVMRKRKENFVWKYDGKRTPDMPSNLYTASWLPQQAILAHPNIKAFVTHGGLLGIHEAVWQAVPMVAMPLFAEQDFNAARIHATGRGIMLDVQEVTVEKLDQVLEQVISDPKYKSNMKKASNLFRDRPSHPTDTAVWWTEYVLRHDNSDFKFLKPLGMHQTWYQRRLLDVWLVIGLGLVTIIVFTLLLGWKLVKVVLKALRGGKTPEVEGAASGMSKRRSVRISRLKEH